MQRSVHGHGVGKSERQAVPRSAAPSSCAHTRTREPKDEVDVVALEDWAEEQPHHRDLHGAAARGDNDLGADLEVERHGDQHCVQCVLT